MNIYDGQTAKFKITEEALKRGGRDPEPGLYRIPLKANVENVNTDTLLLDEERSKELQQL